MDKKSFEYDVRLSDKKGKKFYKTVTLTAGQNFWLVFWELMQEYKCTKFLATINNYSDPVGYIPYPFRWSYYN